MSLFGERRLGSEVVIVEATDRLKASIVWVVLSDLGHNPLEVL